jgi:hypothetical protein
MKNAVSLDLYSQNLELIGKAAFAYDKEGVMRAGGS